MIKENKSRYAVLGLLSQKPMSGYDLKKYFEENLSIFWNESFGQIFPIITQLVQEGLAEKLVEHRDGQSGRHVYAITPQGHKALQEWLLSSTDPHREQIEVLLKLYFGGEAPVPVSMVQVRRLREEHHALMKKYMRIQEEMKREQTGNPHLPYWLLAIRCEIRICQAYVNWCDEALAILEQVGSRSLEAV